MVFMLQCLSEFNLISMLARILLAAIASGAIGLEREQKKRPAGFRTYLLVGCGATITVLIGQYLLHYWATINPSIGVDPSRISAQVINGIGFLGAGTIIVTDREKVKGLTTAAGLWATACLGLVIGSGAYYTGILGCILILFCLRMEKIIERTFFNNSKNINVYIEMNKIVDMKTIINEIKALGFIIYDFEIVDRKSTSDNNFAAIFYLSMNENKKHEKVIGELSEISEVSRIEEI